MEIALACNDEDAQSVCVIFRESMSIEQSFLSFTDKDACGRGKCFE